LNDQALERRRIQSQNCNGNRRIDLAGFASAIDAIAAGGARETESHKRFACGQLPIIGRYVNFGRPSAALRHLSA
jgi:hypothetical protein